MNTEQYDDIRRQVEHRFKHRDAFFADGRLTDDGELETLEDAPTRERMQH